MKPLRLLVAVWMAVLAGGGYLALLRRRVATARQVCAEVLAAPQPEGRPLPADAHSSRGGAPLRRPIPPPRLATPPAGGSQQGDYNAPERRLERANRVLAIARSETGFREAQEAAALDSAASAAELSPAERTSIAGYMREFQSVRRQMRDEHERFTDPEQLTDQLHRIVAAKKERNEKIRALLGEERARRFFAAETEESNRFSATHSAADFSGGSSQTEQRGGQR
jgi:hypothetical protein